MSFWKARRKVDLEEEDQPMPEVKEKPTPPQEIELTELEAMKLTAIGATMGKLYAEIQVAELQIEKLRRSIGDRSSKIPKFVTEVKQIHAAVAGRHGLLNIDAYDIDLAAKMCCLRPTSAGGQ